jgi:hypothetical protein
MMTYTTNVFSSFNKFGKLEVVEHRFFALGNLLKHTLQVFF